MYSWSLFLAIAGLSFGAGAFGALLGLGGGVIIVPALTLLLGIDIRLAIGASIVSVIATSSGAAASYVRDGLTNVRVGMFLELGTALGAIAGALIAGAVSDRVLYVVFSVVLAGTGLAMLRRRDGSAVSREGDALARRLRLDGSYQDAASGQVVTYRATHTIPVLGLSCTAGVASGLLGIGGGPLMVPAMNLAMKLPLKVASATSNLMIGVTAAASAAVYMVRGQIDPAIAAPVAIGVLCGARFGSWLMVQTRERALRLIFVGLLGVLAVQMLLKGLS